MSATMKKIFLYLLVSSGLAFLSGCGKSEAEGDVVAMKGELVALRGEIAQLRQVLVALSQQTNRPARPSALAGASRAMERTHRPPEEELKARRERREQLIAEHKARMEERRRRMEERKAAREAARPGQVLTPQK